MDINRIEQLEILLEKKSPTQIFDEFQDNQLRIWPMAERNYKALEKVEEKEFQFDGCIIRVQFNPERIISSVAKTDKQSIQNRACFLCQDKLPYEQQGIAYKDNFVILLNPFPIIPQHFTIPRINHEAQCFGKNIEAMLSLSKSMEGFTLFYNGPKCGASAPDHMHFQAGTAGFMPVEKEYEKAKREMGEIIAITKSAEIRNFSGYLRKMISIESADCAEMNKVVSLCYRQFSELQADGEEPMLNVISGFVDGKYIVHMFPRKLHRPWQYFAEGEKQIILSPASVDFGGVFITPRREDFEKITKDDICDIFQQVSVDDHFFRKLCCNIKEEIHKQ